ncbi:MAG: glycosyltransferase [Pseudomonadota bacterium]
MMPTVSINLCCYNSERYLRETLDSIVNQTYKDWELIVINDGSSDSTESIIKEYMDKGFPIIYHYQENKGLGYSRNEALKRSRGKFIAFIDHDDLWMPEKLEKQMPLFDDPEIGLVFSDSIVFNNAGSEKRFYGGQNYYTGYCFRELLKNYTLNIQTVIIRRSVIKSIEWFDQRFNIIEDTDLFLRIAYDWKLAIVDESLARWRIHSNSLTQTKGHLVAGETDDMLIKFQKMIPDFIKRYGREVEILKSQISISRAKNLWKQGNGKAARKCLSPYFIKNKKILGLYIISYFPEPLASQILNRRRGVIQSQQDTPIQVLIYEPYPMGLGGNFFTQRLILERLDRGKFTPLVVAPMDGVALEEFRKMGVECVVMPPPSNLDSYGGAVLRDGMLGKLKTVYNLVRYNLQLTRFLRDRKINVVYANCVRAEMCIGLAARLTKTPSVLYVKGELANPIIDHICFLLAKKILFFCVQNRDDKYKHFIRLIKKKVEILKIGLAPNIITDIENTDNEDIKSELCINPKYINTAIIAQLYRQKGQHFVVEALALLVKEFQQLRLYLLGDHVIEDYRPYKNELELLIIRYGLKNNVFFTGWRKDGLRIAKEMDIIIHPSLAEGFGRAVLESMALGKPVIASKVGGLREIIKDGYNGFLVEPGDVEAIVKRWRELILDGELRRRLGKEAKKTVFAEYLIDDKVHRFANICAELAKGSY